MHSNVIAWGVALNFTLVPRYPVHRLACLVSFIFHLMMDDTQCIRNTSINHLDSKSLARNINSDIFSELHQRTNAELGNKVLFVSKCEDSYSS